MIEDTDDSKQAEELYLAWENRVKKQAISSSLEKSDADLKQSIDETKTYKGNSDYSVLPHRLNEGQITRQVYQDVRSLKRLSNLIKSNIDVEMPDIEGKDDDFKFTQSDLNRLEEARNINEGDRKILAVETFMNRRNENDPKEIYRAKSIGAILYMDNENLDKQIEKLRNELNVDKPANVSYSKMKAVD